MTGNFASDGTSLKVGISNFDILIIYIPFKSIFLTLISVPTPVFVNISSNRQCGTRPSMICTPVTPASIASIQP